MFRRRGLRLVVIMAVALVFASGTAVQAEMQIGESVVQGETLTLYTEIRTIGTLQALDQSNSTNTLPDRSAGIATAFGDLAWRLDVSDYAELYFDVTIASRVREDRVWGHEGYMTFKRLPAYSPLAVLNPVMEHMDLKVGHFDLAYGWYPETSSINAETQKNPLVGNYVVRPLATEPGLEIISENRIVNWIAGAGIGTSTGDYHEDRGWSYHARLWRDVAPGVELAGSFYRVDHSGHPLRFGGGPGHLFSTERLGGRYGGVFGDGNAPGNVLPGNGVDVTAYQLDLRTNPTESLQLDALYGTVEDADVNSDSAPIAGVPADAAEEWDYYGLTVKQSLTENVYGAARYSVAELQVDESFATPGTSGEVTRVQVGLGVWATRHILLKLEYVDEQAEDFTTDSALDVDATIDPEFDGAVMEVNMTF